MDVKTIAYIIYLFMMAIHGVVLAKAKISFADLKYWILVFIPVIAYLCGYVRGG